MGFTRNLGNFENMKMEIDLEIDNVPGESPSQTFTRAADWVEKKFIERFQQVEVQVAKE